MLSDDHSLYQLVSKHPAAVIPGLYLVGSTIGMLDSWWYFRQFGVDIFLYSDISDYLLASFREPGAWLIVAFSSLVLLLDHAASRRFERSKQTSRWLRWYGTRLYRQSGWLMFIAMVTAYILTFAGFRARFVFEGRSGSELEVVLADDSAVSATLLGSTINFLFLYDRDRHSVSIHPYDNVVTVSSAAPPRSP